MGEVFIGLRANTTMEVIQESAPISQLVKWLISSLDSKAHIFIKLSANHLFRLAICDCDQSWIAVKSRFIAATEWA